MQHISKGLKDLKIPIDISHKESGFYSFILTEYEANSVIANELKRLSTRMATKMRDLGYTISQIDERLKTTDFTVDIDEVKLLSDANVRKHWDNEKKEMEADRIRKEKEQHLEVQEKCNAKYFFNLIQYSFKKERKVFVQDEYSNPYIKVVCFFMSNDTRFENELQLDLNKGLWIVGKAGLGKTRLIEAVAENELASIKIVSMLDVADKVLMDGSYSLDWSNRSKILFDDVGSEQATVNHYGTKINWFKDYIELFYAKRSKFSKLLVTTNCDFDEIEEKYGYRVRSRVREMFNVIYVNGEDRRK